MNTITIIGTSVFIALCLWVGYLEYRSYYEKTTRYKKASKILSLEKKTEEVLKLTIELHEQLRCIYGLATEPQQVEYKDSLERDLSDAERRAIDVERRLHNKNDTELVMEELSRTSINGLKLEGLKPGILKKVREYASQKSEGE